MRKDRELEHPRSRGFPNRIRRGREIGASYVLNVTDRFTGESYPVYVYPGQKLGELTQQFVSMKFTIDKIT